MSLVSIAMSITLLHIIGRLESALSTRQLDSNCMETLAQLYLWNKQYEKALNCYLDIQYDQSINSNTSMNFHDRRTNSICISNSFVGNNSIILSETESTATNSLDMNKIVLNNISKSEEKLNFIHVFELIEKQRLFSNIREKIINLFRLSKELAVNLLLKHIDKFSISHVVKQLKPNRKLLHYYLQFMFLKYESYNIDNIYAEYHVMQISLYAEFSPKFQRIESDEFMNGNDSYNQSSNNNNNIETYDNFAELISLRRRNEYKITEFMVFLQTSKFYPLDFALRECEKQNPPLYYEMIYILDSKGMKREALVRIYDLI